MLNTGAQLSSPEMAAENIEDAIIVTNGVQKTDGRQPMNRQENDFAPKEFVPGNIIDRDKWAKHNSSASRLEDVSDSR